jgi:hypothetical protein
MDFREWFDFKDSENVHHTFEICHNSTFIQQMVD